MEPIKEYTCKLRTTDFNCFEQLRPSAVLDLFQDLATEHSVDIGMGFEDLQKKGLFWVVVRQKLEFCKDATYQPRQQVVVRTWPHSLSRLNIMRDYSLSDTSGNILAKGTSEWLLLNIETRKFVSVQENFTGSTDFCEDRAFSGKLKKIKDFPTDEASVGTLVPQFSDIDFNMHVNNARYTDYILNAAPPTKETPLHTLQIDYRKELMPHEPVQIYTLTDEAGTHVKGVTTEGDVSFNSLLTF